MPAKPSFYENEQGRMAYVKVSEPTFTRDELDRQFGPGRWIETDPPTGEALPCPDRTKPT